VSDNRQLRPTAAAALAATALFGLAVGGLIRPLVERSGGIAPAVTWGAPGTLVVFTLLVLILARGTHKTIQERREYIEPRRAVNLLVLGKATALAGAAFAGAYLGYALSFVGDWEIELPRERVTRSLTACAAALALMVAGLLLERACRVPGDPDDSDDPLKGGGVASGNS
jgi:predicted permease